MQNCDALIPSFLHLFFIFIEVQLIYNVVLVSGVQPSDSVIGTCLVAQLVKNAPAMQETWVRSLGWEVPLEKGKATHSSLLAWRIPWTV